jgi:hypothetical protein
MNMEELKNTKEYGIVNGILISLILGMLSIVYYYKFNKEQK